MNLNQVYKDLETYVLSHGGKNQFLQENEMFEGIISNYYYLNSNWIQVYSSVKIILPNTALSILEREFERATLLSVSCQTFVKLQNNLQEKLER